MADNQGITYGEPHPEPEAPQDFVIVLAYRSPDGEVEEDFGRLANDIKALYTFKRNVRVYALVENAAKNVLAKVEKSDLQPSGKATVVISYDQPTETEDSFRKVSEVLDKVRHIFEDEEGVEVRIAIRESADEVLGVFERDGA